MPREGATAARYFNGPENLDALNSRFAKMIEGVREMLVQEFRTRNEHVEEELRCRTELVSRLETKIRELEAQLNRSKQVIDDARSSVARLESKFGTSVSPTGMAFGRPTGCAPSRPRLRSTFGSPRPGPLARLSGDANANRLPR